MNNKAKNALVMSFFFAMAALLTFAAVMAGPKACNNGLDDDGDGLTDYPNDPGCSSRNDNSERSASLVCDDGLDNDGDTFNDYPNDPGCSSPTDSSELGTTQCDDNLDNDNDAFVDYPDDNGCSSPTDNIESTDSCSDSDGGIAPLTFGAVFGLRNNTNYSNSDICTDSVTLREYFCSSMNAVFTSQNCNNATLNTSVCSGGRCV